MSIQIPEGFTPWAGGENPAPGKVVQDIYCRAEHLWKGSSEIAPTPSESLRWHHTGEGGDILAYRL